jgi:hypothetical protein
VKKSGAWFTYEGKQLGQGKENARQFLAEHADTAQEIDRKIREAVGLTAFENADEPVDMDKIDLTVIEEANGSSKKKPSKKVDDDRGDVAGPLDPDRGARGGSSPKGDDGRGDAASGPLDLDREPTGVPAG